MKTVARCSINPSDQAMIARVVLPEESTIGVREYFDSLGSNSDVSLIRDNRRLHGLCGNPGNNTRKAARSFFKVFGEKNSSPNGRTADVHGRPHGRFRYIDAKNEILLTRSSDDKRLGFCNDVVAKMAGLEFFKNNPKEMVSDRTVERWVNEFFGMTIVADGKTIYNPLITCIYPHMTDACADFESFLGYFLTLASPSKGIDSRATRVRHFIRRLYRR